MWWNSASHITRVWSACHGIFWKWLRLLETQMLFVGSSALPEHRGCFLIASLVMGYSLNTGSGWMCPSIPVQLCFCKVTSAFS